MAAGSSGAVAAVYLCMVVLNLGPLFGCTTHLAPLKEEVPSLARVPLMVTSAAEHQSYVVIYRLQGLNVTRRGHPG
ncbi:hypothetical protein KUCAC02_011821, partial [Chaenocephalus aceratus]